MSDLISNITIDQSNRYAKGQEIRLEFEKQHGGLGEFVSSSTTIQVKTITNPFIDSLIGTPIKISWAIAEAPDGYYDTRSISIFVIGSPEAIEAKIKDLSAFIEQHPELASQKPETLLTSLATLLSYNNDVNYVNAARNSLLGG
jgi:hypothetical protein